jgi:exodeoxyribonuclease-5
MKNMLKIFEGLSSGIKADNSQRLALETLEQFVQDDLERGVLVMTGPAGSGKTFMMKALVRWMRQEDKPIVLLAPTGRAAKVLAQTARCRANTLHRQLYRPVEDDLISGKVFRVRFELKSMVKDEPCVFVVDEASMMGNGSGGGESLISDLLQQVYESSSWHKIILVGDPYQLPPVGETESPAFFSSSWTPRGCDFRKVELAGRYRQAEQSPVLNLAGRILEWMEQEQACKGRSTGEKDGSGLGFASAAAPDQAVNGNTGYRIGAWWAAFGEWVRDYAQGGDEEEPLWHASLGTAIADFDRHYEPGQSVVLANSNAWAAKFNNGFRHRRYPQRDRRPQSGESLLVVRNQYLSGGQLLANGEEVRMIRNLGKTHQHAGMAWINALLEWTGMDGDDRTFEGKICLDLLDSGQASLNPVQQQALWKHRVVDRNSMEKDPYLSALWVKYPYAQTVHKAQGGAWPRVYLLLERPFAVQDPVSYLRWLYTAVTRCSDRLILVQPRD